MLWLVNRYEGKNCLSVASVLSSTGATLRKINHCEVVNNTTTCTQKHAYTIIQ